MNNIWHCKIFLKKRNPNQRSKEPFVYDSLTCLIILDKDLNYVKIRTNDKVVGRNIRQECSKDFTVADIHKIEPIKKHGRSYAKD